MKDTTKTRIDGAVLSLLFIVPVGLFATQVDGCWQFIETICLVCAVVFSLAMGMVGLGWLITGRRE